MNALIQNCKETVSQLHWTIFFEMWILKTFYFEVANQQTFSVVKWSSNHISVFANPRHYVSNGLVLKKKNYCRKPMFLYGILIYGWALLLIPKLGKSLGLICCKINMFASTIYHQLSGVHDVWEHWVFEFYKFAMTSNRGDHKFSELLGKNFSLEMHSVASGSPNVPTLTNALVWNSQLLLGARLLSSLIAIQENQLLESILWLFFFLIMVEKWGTNSRIN